MIENIPLIINNKSATIGEKIASIYIPKVISTNALLQVSSYKLFSKKTGRPIQRLAASKAYENYQIEVEQELHKQGYHPKLLSQLPTYPVFLHIVYHPPITKQGIMFKKYHDLGNLEKAISDVLQGNTKKQYGYFFADDKQIVGILSQLGKNSHTSKPFLTVTIYKVNINDQN